MVAVVLVAFYRHRQLLRILRELDSAAGEFRYVVVNNSPGSGTNRALAEFSAETSRPFLTIPAAGLKFTPSLNIGLREALPGEDMAFYICSVHTKVHDPSWLPDSVAWMRERRDVGLGGCVQGTGRIGAHFGNEHGLPQYRRHGDRFDYLRHIDGDWWAKADKRRLTHVQGGLWAVRTAMADDIGLPYERFHHGFVDVEYSYRAASRGWELGRIPGVVATDEASPAHPPGTVLSHDRGDYG